MTLSYKCFLSAVSIYFDITERGKMVLVWFVIEFLEKQCLGCYLLKAPLYVSIFLFGITVHTCHVELSEVSEQVVETSTH
jgi:hypothetical protein